LFLEQSSLFACGDDAYLRADHEVLRGRKHLIYVSYIPIDLVVYVRMSERSSVRVGDMFFAFMTSSLR